MISIRQTDTGQLTRNDVIIWSRVLDQIAREVSTHIWDAYRDDEEYAESIENFLIMLKEEVAPAPHNVGMMILIRMVNQYGLQLMKCQLTGCENQRDHDLYKAMITTVLYARDKVIDGCIAEGIIPGISLN